MLANYLKIALKVLLRRKFYTAVSLVGVAFTLAVLMLATALVDNAIRPGAPEVDLDRTLVINRAAMAGPQDRITSSPGYRLLDGYARDLPGAEKFSIVENVRTVTSFVDGEKVSSRMRRVDEVFWQILKFDFVEGGPFTRADLDAGSFVAVVSESSGRRLLGDGPATGKTVRADGQSFTVVGVVKDVPITRMTAYADLWVPISTMKTTAYRDSLMEGFEGIVLAESRDAMPGIQAELTRRLTSVELPDPERYDTLRAGAFTRFERIAAEFASTENVEDAQAGRLAFAFVLLALGFMILPALNMVNLSLSRILERASEIGVRKAFGASAGTLVGQFLVENVVLTLAGGALGFALSALALRAVSDSDLIPYADLRMSVRVFLAGLGLSLIFAVLAGAFPAWKMSRLHPVEALHGRVR